MHIAYVTDINWQFAFLNLERSFKFISILGCYTSYVSAQASAVFLFTKFGAKFDSLDVAAFFLSSLAILTSTGVYCFSCFRIEMIRKAPQFPWPRWDFCKCVQI